MASRATARRGASGTESKATADKRLRVLDVAKMVDTDPPPIPYVVPGIAIERTLTLIAGREGEGKSLWEWRLLPGSRSASPSPEWSAGDIAFSSSTPRTASTRFIAGSSPLGCHRQG